MGEAIEHHFKRLDHLQGIVQRLAGNSFLIKGWAVTIVSAVLGFALKDPATTANLAYIALVPIILFWGLDAYYLAVERKVRIQYNQDTVAVQNILSGKGGTLPDARIQTARPGFLGWLCAALAAASWILYLILCICVFSVASGVFVRVVQTIGVRI